MATFITLTDCVGTCFKLRVDSIEAYRAADASDREKFPNANCTIMLRSCATFVTETPEQIDALLGVAADPVPALIEALQTVRVGCPTAEREAEARYGKNWRNDVINATIRAARGE